MNRILTMLGIDSPDEFEYFEDFAEIMESDETLEEADFYGFFGKVDMDTLYEITGNYIDDISENLPDRAVELYTLLETVKKSLLGLIKSTEDDEEAMPLLCGELFKFRNWYSVEKNARFGDEELPLLEALAEARFKKLDNAEADFDFSKALEYELDEYIVSFADIIDDGEDEDGEEDEE